MRVLFLDCIDTPYNSQSVREMPMGGIGATTTALAETLSARGHDVTCINQLGEDMRGVQEGVHWDNYESYDFSNPENLANIVVVNNDARLFRFASACLQGGALPVLWLRNRVLLEKTIRLGRMGFLLRYWPVAVFLGEKQKMRTSILHPFRDRVVLPHGLTEQFLGYDVLSVSPPKQAIFFSQAYRGFAEVVRVWMEYVHPKHKDAVLKAFVGNVDLASLGLDMSAEEMRSYGIELMPKVSKTVLIEALRNSRVMIYPGHKDETFCNAAAEASALGVPIVTYGIGSLSERIEDGKNGFIVPQRNRAVFGDAVCRIFEDDALWQILSRQAIEKMRKESWDERAKLWEDRIFSKVL